MPMPLSVDEESVRRILTWDRLLPCIENALKQFSLSNDVIQPLRTRMEIEDKSGLLLLMPGFLPSDSALAIKIISVFPDNHKLTLSSHSASILLCCAQTGKHLALIEGESVTELRTAASSAVATRKLCDGSPKRIAILGAGTQGKAHARVLHHVFKPEEIRIWSQTESRSVELSDLLVKEGIPAVSVKSVKEAVKDADVINTCTLSPLPILFQDDVKNGAHINAVGAPHPDHQEIDPRLMLSATVIADSKEAAEKESGDVILSGSTIFCEIGAILSCEEKENNLRSRTTIFKSLGMAVLDAAAAKLVYDHL